MIMLMMIIVKFLYCYVDDKNNSYVETRIKTLKVRKIFSLGTCFHFLKNKIKIKEPSDWKKMQQNVVHITTKLKVRRGKK